MNQSLIMMKKKKSKKCSYLLNKMFKRGLDIVVSSMAIVTVSPLLLYASYKIKKEDNGPILFKQKRSGLNNKVFQMYKLRSMKINNNIIGTHTKDRVLYDNWDGKVPNDFVFKSATSTNPNVTNIGSMIREYSIDELPQFFNVLKGDMSIVGPRPEIIEITQYYDLEQKRRLEVKPGITGWAQINGRSEMNHGQKIEYDLWYVENANILLDAKIILYTIIQVFRTKGAM